MNRKTFLTRLGGAGVLAAFPVSSVFANKKSDAQPGKNVAEKIVKKNQGNALTILGNRQLHKVVGKDTNNQLVEWVDYLTPGSGIPPHIHTKEDEVFRVVEGQIELMVDGKITILEAGDMAFAPKNIVHSWKVVGDTNAQLCVSAFPAGMEHMFEEFNAMPPGKPDFEKIAEISATYGIRFV